MRSSRDTLGRRVIPCGLRYKRCFYSSPLHEPLESLHDVPCGVILLQILALDLEYVLLQRFEVIADGTTIQKNWLLETWTRSQAWSAGPGHAYIPSPPWWCVSEQTTEKTIHTIFVHGTNVACSEVQTQPKSTIALSADPSLQPTVRWTSYSEQKGLQQRPANRIYSRNGTYLLPTLSLCIVHNENHQVHKNTKRTKDTKNQGKWETVMAHLTVNSLAIGWTDTGIGVRRAVSTIQTPRGAFFHVFYSDTTTKGEPPTAIPKSSKQTNGSEYTPFMKQKCRKQRESMCIQEEKTTHNKKEGTIRV